MGLRRVCGAREQRGAPAPPSCLCACSARPEAPPPLFSSLTSPTARSEIRFPSDTVTRCRASCGACERQQFWPRLLTAVRGAGGPMRRLRPGPARPAHPRPSRAWGPRAAPHLPKGGVLQRSEMRKLLREPGGGTLGSPLRQSGGSGCVGAAKREGLSSEGSSEAETGPRWEGTRSLRKHPPYPSVWKLQDMSDPEATRCFPR